jgi:hypothetical protein
MAAGLGRFFFILSRPRHGHSHRAAESEKVPGLAGHVFVPESDLVLRRGRSVDDDGQWERHGTALGRIILGQAREKREGPMELSTACWRASGLTTPPFQPERALSASLCTSWFKSRKA